MPFSDLTTVLHEYGWQWMAWRGWYEISLRKGLFQRSLPPGIDLGERLARESGIDAARLPSWLYEQWSSSSVFFLEEDLSLYRPFIGDPEAVIREADQIIEGKIAWFHRSWREVGSPPDWHQGANGTRWPDDCHWSSISDLSPELGDIKYVWEPSRFAQAFTWVRAYALTGDERYPEAFWSHVESWIGANPPEIGPNWRCAQEMALRSLAWIFGLFGFRGSPHSTPPRVARLLQQLWYHSHHIEKVHWYARRCVRNNHTLSEAAGLFTVGTLLPFLPRANGWKERGLNRFAEETAWQVYEDGTFIQFSMNYSRLVAQLFSWVISLAQANGMTLPSPIRERAESLLQLLFAVQNSPSGRVPNYGSNDGALIFPLSSSDYLDYRPALGALNAALGHSPLYPAGPWQEEAAWFGHRSTFETSRSALPSPASAFDEGGFYTFRGAETHALIRCATLRHRPIQADMLHLDVWYGDQNVLIDPGTYSYSVEAAWSDYFSGTLSHNTVTVDGRHQMKRRSRFMWLHWTRSRLLRYERTEDATIFEGEHYGYAPVVHQRTVALRDEVYLVLDHLFGGEAEHAFRLHWMLNDFPLVCDGHGALIPLPGISSPLRLRVAASDGGEGNWARGEETPPRGWHSLYYGERLPAWSYENCVEGRSARFLTLLGPKEKVDLYSDLSFENLDRFLGLETTEQSTGSPLHQ